MSADSTAAVYGDINKVTTTEDVLGIPPFIQPESGLMLTGHGNLAKTATVAMKPSGKLPTQYRSEKGEWTGNQVEQHTYYVSACPNVFLPLAKVIQAKAKEGTCILGGDNKPKDSSHCQVSLAFQAPANALADNPQLKLACLRAWESFQEIERIIYERLPLPLPGYTRNAPFFGESFFDKPVTNSKGYPQVPVFNCFAKKPFEHKDDLVPVTKWPGVHLMKPVESAEKPLVLQVPQHFSAAQAKHVEVAQFDALPWSELKQNSWAAGPVRVTQVTVDYCHGLKQEFVTLTCQIDTLYVLRPPKEWSAVPAEALYDSPEQQDLFYQQSRMPVSVGPQTAAQKQAAERRAVLSQALAVRAQAAVRSKPAAQFRQPVRARDNEYDLHKLLQESAELKKRLAEALQNGVAKKAKKAKATPPKSSKRKTVPKAPKPSRRVSKTARALVDDIAEADDDEGEEDEEDEATKSDKDFIDNGDEEEPPSPGADGIEAGDQE